MTVDLQAKAEKSIREEYHASLFAPFCKACKTYELICPGDRIAPGFLPGVKKVQR